MKLKQKPEDFQVQELTETPAGSDGEHAFYELEKSGIGTLEAVSAISRRWKIDRQRISFAGLKDRHAVTKQYLTIAGGPSRGMQQSRFHLRFLGRSEREWTSDQICGNRFCITMRGLSQARIEACVSRIDEVRRYGVANYFDDQRFGSVGPSRQFVARKLIDEDYETALKLALIEPYEFDNPREKKAKRSVRQYWGDWKRLSSEGCSSVMRRVVSHLKHNSEDFRGALALLPMDQKTLYLASYQSYLWNDILAGWMEQQIPREQLGFIRLRLGWYPVWKTLERGRFEEWKETALPLPSARLALEGGGNSPAQTSLVSRVIENRLKREGLTLSQMKLRHFRRPFFSKGDRPVLFVPGNLEFWDEADELNEEKRKLLLRFELPRGCYATMFVKRLSAVREQASSIGSGHGNESRRGNAKPADDAMP